MGFRGGIRGSRISRIDQRIGQPGTEITPETIGAELDSLHERLNRIELRGDRFLARRIVSESSNVLLDDSYIGVYTGNGAITLMLPSVSSAIPLRLFVFKDENGYASTNNITVVPYDASETIDGAVSATINTDYGALNLFSTGKEWFSI